MLTKSTRGHLVTIQPTQRAARPFLDTKSEISELITHLGGVVDENDGSMPTARRCSVQLSTIIYSSPVKSDKLFNVLELRSLREVATRIIDGIRHERRTLKITERRSLIDYMCDTIKLKFI